MRKEKKQEFIKNSGVSLLMQALRPVVSLLTLPLIIALVGKEGLGVWMIGLALMAVLSSVNSGLGITLVSKYAKAIANNDLTEKSMLITSSLRYSMVVGLWVLIIGTIILYFIKISWFAEISVIDEGDIKSMLIVMMIFILLNITLAVPRQMMVANGYAYKIAIAEFAGLTVTLILLSAKANDVITLKMLALYYLLPNFVLNMALLYYHSARDIKKAMTLRIRNTSYATIRGESNKMLIYQFSYSISSQTDLLIIGAVLGAELAADFGVAQRLFAIPMMIAMASNQALWPILSRSKNQKKMTRDFIIKYLSIQMLISLLVASSLSIFFDKITIIWLGHKLDIPSSLLIAFSLQVFMGAVVGVLDMVLRVQEDHTTLRDSMIKMACLNVILSVILIDIVGPAGVVYGTVISNVVFLVFPYSKLIAKRLGG